MHFKNPLRSSAPKSDPSSTPVDSQPPTVPQRTGRTPNMSGNGTPQYPGSRLTSKPGSRPGSVYGNRRATFFDPLLAAKMVLGKISQEQDEKILISYPATQNEGAVVRVENDDFIASPHLVPGTVFYETAKTLNSRVVWTIKNMVILKLVEVSDEMDIELRDGRKMQVLSSMGDLLGCRRHIGAALIRDAGLLVVWKDSADQAISYAQDLQQQMMFALLSEESGAYNEFNEKAFENEKEGHFNIEEKELSEEGSERVTELPIEDLAQEKPRRPVLIMPVLSACTVFLIIAASGTGWRQLAVEVIVDHSYIRLALLLVTPLQIWLALFFMQSVVGCVAQMIGPIAQMRSNSKYYSGEKPKMISRNELPHVTIQCPVYKESLHATIIPTVESIRDAIAMYESRGGTANIFINDDGMHAGISQEDADERRQFYAQQGIGYVARPKHYDPAAKSKRSWCGLGSKETKRNEPKEDEEWFVRAGKFKKASNMNYAMHFSAQVEDKLAEIPRPEGWTKMDEYREYVRCAEEVLETCPKKTAYGGDVRMGDYILLIDSDTRVPKDCLIYAVSEMEQSPQVAILQFTSGVTNVSSTFFEMGITFFTNLIYTSIKYAVSNGDVAPFVGHNAVLRWSALQDISYVGEQQKEMYWSESTVSEDFDMALRLQIQGYVVRYASYSCTEDPKTDEEMERLKHLSNDEREEFKEGVSLTVYDELSRWEKYAYGCSELLFHPFVKWPTKGPFTPLFRMFMGSKMPLPSKLTIMAYVGTYFAIGSAWILTLLNYFIVGWYNGHIDHYYIDSFKIYFAIIIVFNGLGNLALAMLRVRAGEQNLFPALWGNFKWVLLLSIFLGGISLHVSQAILCHLFSINIEWGATMKEQMNVPFNEEIRKVLSKFKVTFIVCIVAVAGIVYLATFAPAFWRISFFTAIYPLAYIIFSHFALPIVLNPGLMRFKW